MNILRLSTLSLALAIAILTLGYGNLSIAGKKCDEDDQHPSCKPDDGDPIEYTAKLTAGAFLIEIDGETETVDVTSSSFDNSLQSGTDVVINRPPVTDSSPNEEMQWDSFFNGICSNLLGSTEVLSLAVARGNFEVTMTSSADVRVILNDIVLPDKNGNDAVVTVQLITHDPDFELFPAPGSSAEVKFTHGAIYGRSKKGGRGGSQGCQESGGGSFEEFPLIYSESELTITAPD